MNFLHALGKLRSIRDKLHLFINNSRCDVKGIDGDINFLKQLFDDHLDTFTAEEQNKLVNLIQKLILIRDMKGIK